MTDQYVPETDQADKLADIAAREEAAFQRYKRGYLQRVSPPAQPNVVDIRSIGFMFWFYLMQSLAAIILGASRTANMFFKVATAAQNTTLAYVEAASAVFAVEGGMVVYAAARAIKQRSTSTKWITISLIFMALISGIAGLGESSKIIQNIDPEVQKILEYALAVILGAGSSVVVYVAGEVIGGQIVAVMNDYQKRLKTYEKELETYNEGMLASWRVSDERKIARGELKNMARSSSVISKQNGTRRTERNNGTLVGPNGNPVRRPPVQTERIFAYMDQAWAERGEVPTVSELVNALGVAKSTASPIRHRWLEEHDVEVAQKERLAEGSNGNGHHRE